MLAYLVYYFLSGALDKILKCKEDKYEKNVKMIYPSWLCKGSGNEA
ncbi:hypothetical protein [Clostridium gelidum]|nr:hypothetical protein [Clostridium gelidum]